MDYLPSIEISNTASAPCASVIWLHGLGASGHDFEPIVPQLNLPSTLAVRFIFPHAPSIPVTVNMGFIMPAWYDILDMALERKVDTAQLKTSARRIADLIDREISRGIPSERVIIAGFSQGAAVAYEAALHYPHPLAGLLAMSGYLATAASLNPHPANQNLPIAIMHGTLDSVVPHELSLQARQRLEQLGYAPYFRDYEMDHEVCNAQVNDISALFQAWLGG